MGHMILHDRDVIERYLRQEPQLHVYELGDLGGAGWPLTCWHGLEEDGVLSAVVMLYYGFSTPTLLALGDTAKLSRLLSDMGRLLPETVYCNLSPGLADAVSATHTLSPRGRHYKMAMTDRAKAASVDSEFAVPLTLSKASDIKTFYDQSFPENWFQLPLLGTGRYFGIYENGSLACAAGVHVFSPKYRVAAVGNVTTRPLSRGRGFATAATAAVCKNLFADVDIIGLNVRQDNATAIACYRKLGFDVVGEFEEYLAVRR